MTTRKRRRLPRCAWLAALCVVLGLMTSVGVAWGAVWRFFYGGKIQPLSSVSVRTGAVHPIHGELWWNAWRNEAWGITYTSAQFPDTHHSTNLGGDPASEREYQAWVAVPTCVATLRKVMPQLATREYWAVEFCVQFAGWPLRCLSWQRVSNAESVAVLVAGGSSGPNEYDAATIDPSFRVAGTYHMIHMHSLALPVGPLWPGLLADTAFYAGAWGALIFTPLFVRRRLRRRLRARRGACVRCGYSREGLSEGATCPECGQGA